MRFPSDDELMAGPNAFDDAAIGPDGHGTAGGTGGTAGTGAAGSRAAGRRGRGQPTAEEIEDSLIESRTGR